MALHNKNARVGRAAKGWHRPPRCVHTTVEVRPADLVMLGSPSMFEVKGVSPEVFRQIGVMTRQILDTMKQVGVMPRLSTITGELPDARSRLNYIVEKTTDAANKVLNLVDAAKEEQAKAHQGCDALKDWAQSAGLTDAQRAEASQLIAMISQPVDRMGEQMTDIMMAQDFHDLTGQVVKKVVALAVSLEEDLVSLFMQLAPEAVEESRRNRKAETDASEAKEAAALQGPVVDPGKTRTDVVADQSEVDDLLASLGF
ncbi:protein phosphatase CheZ [Amphibiibacter pelophylacis]|uniref:Protein phosphatase CheZ n=1 Tax=Amphibiibacter pelophylacis TaxID=1799477 RepID=A0ACC6P3C9_9BURK